jgi:cytochrome c oxidase subunit I+III
VAEGRWPAIVPGVSYPVAASVLLAAGAGAVAWASRALARDARVSFSAAAVTALLAIAAAFAVDLLGMRGTSLSPRDSSYGAIVYALIATQGLFATLVAIMLLYSLARAWTGRLTAMRRGTFDHAMLMAYYTVAQGALGLALVHGFPRWTG